MAVTERSYVEAGLGRVFTLTSGAITAEIIEYGARLRSCVVPDAEGRLADIVPGFDSPADYMDRGGSMGAICGRYGNRIPHGRIVVDGEPFQLSVNAPPHCLHGGFNHFGRHFWTGEALPTDNAVRLTFVSPDGDEGWPGTLNCEVVYRLEGKRLHIEMKATTDRATFVNLIFHGYWNLSGHASGSIDDHLLQIAAQRYTPKGDLNVPTGEFAPVEGTPADFRTLSRIGRYADDLPSNGYDHNLCLDHPPGEPDMPAGRPEVRPGVDDHHRSARGADFHGQQLVEPPRQGWRHLSGSRRRRPRNPGASEHAEHPRLQPRTAPAGRGLHAQTGGRVRNLGPGLRLPMTRACIAVPCRYH